MKKIGIVIGQLSYGGAEKQVVLLTKGLKARGQYEPIVFCISNNVEPYGTCLTQNSITWYALPDQIVNPFQKILWLYKINRREKVSLFYGILNIGNIYASIVGLVSNKPLICSIRNADPFLSWPIRILSRWSCNRADFIVANSASCERSLRVDLRVQNNRVVIIENAVTHLPIDEKARNIKRKDWGLAEDVLVIGTISNLKEQKQPLYFIEIFRVLSQLYNKRDLYFVWIGDGPKRCQVKKAISILDINIRDRILFPGARDDIYNVLRAFDVFILTSSYEGMPNALIEAMSVGLPCVATNVPGTEDVLSKMSNGSEIGVLASSSNPEAFSKALYELLIDQDRMKKMGNEAQKYIHSHYSLEKMVSTHCDILDEVLASKQKGRAI